MTPHSTAPVAACRPQIMPPSRPCEASPLRRWLRGLAVALVLIALALPATADAQRKKRKRGRRDKDAAGKVHAKKKGRTKVFDFTGLELGGRLRTPQLLYFLDRAEQELDRAALEKRSFIPEMTRSLEEGRL